MISHKIYWPDLALILKFDIWCWLLTFGIWPLIFSIIDYKAQHWCTVSTSLMNSEDISAIWKHQPVLIKHLHSSSFKATNLKTKNLVMKTIVHFLMKKWKYRLWTKWAFWPLKSSVPDIQFPIKRGFKKNPKMIMHYQTIVAFRRLSLARTQTFWLVLICKFCSV